MTREFRTVGVVGLGTMGAGIVEVFARNGLQVIAAEINDEAVARGRSHLETSTTRAIERGKLSREDADELLGRITTTTALADLADCDLVVEAVPEHLDLKAGVLAELDKVMRPEAILASNTSSLSVTELAVRTSRPGKVVGMHFFNPAPVQKLVELVRTVVTEPDVIEDARAFAATLDKVPVVIGDRAGFIANALLFGYLNHAARMYEARYATREGLDAAMRYGCGYPMGPLALLDLIGLDTAYEILDTMYHESRNLMHAPAPVLKQMITAGLLGRKSGRGFYTYAKPHSSKVVPDADTPAGTVPADANLREIARVGVVGTGTMATGIVEVFAKAGYDVVVRGRSDSKAEAAVATVRKSLDKAVVRGKIGEAERDAALARITPTTRLEDMADVDLVVEAIAEELDVKRAVFGALDEICKPGVILATTTSSLPVVECAAATTRPGDVVGLHFFNPAPVMKLVEVVSTITTSPDVTATALALCEKLDKVPVSCGDRAGFIVNALLFPYLNDAVKMLEAHYATADDIDAAMKTGCALPMGPFELLDVVGLDVSLAIEKSLFQEFRQSGFAPAPLLEHLVTAGRLGRKTGHGFRDYARR
ncbi:3-hydroxyacyl-CoA dehydrogenase., 3-hydroxybutyryl-CoA dehydrogenase [Pseudonocardia dioxanivorans CB1190]|uniref:3-hydroxyacyl-CoA dehydrogenase., 3-hydroxybutyryl-CoA dehydrogenase n=1 Tax=Pseudonocardia dioxanivorans (strain ATCC 55486 / DSM 44775 / JCM 13855 / CB1190) TaxID=675635 RepID=F4CKV2_PSEUX|nr:3-hydroxybutyryl-CoA dehydrogenase [Pseudonocardia dioxanivorans]AEA23945.1 3-hydroxyacyl-CoA dehydrogenase., 3-hydroxybutyryl-CoA dehydrogenase [Pseudonocardia dioxanivorans CB1190]GJF05145.1 3-hydroxybutyryl-CoA dehydrogenase [Pseudonocardia sp. D17]